MRIHGLKIFASLSHTINVTFVFLTICLATYSTWENTYRPEWKDLTVMDWARGNEVQKGGNFDNEHYVKTLAGKGQMDIVTVADLELAKRTVKSYIIVGLMNEMQETVRRFNIVLGIDTEHGGRNARCRGEFFPREQPKTEEETSEENNWKFKTNSNSHPKVRAKEHQLLIILFV